MQGARKAPKRKVTSGPLEFQFGVATIRASQVDPAAPYVVGVDWRRIGAVTLRAFFPPI
jgi:hypothetical protein